MNLWSEFSYLLPKTKLLIGEIVSIDNTNKLSIVQLLTGTNITAKGTSVAVGHMCLIKDGVIMQEMPSLEAYNVTIY